MLKTLIEDFIDFTRFENNVGISIFKENVRIRELIKSVVELYSVQMSEKGILLVLNISHNVPEIFKTDPIRLKQIMMNLISNALKFTLKGKIEIDINLEKQPYKRNLKEGKSEDIDDLLFNDLAFEPLNMRPGSFMKKSKHLVFADKHN